MPRGPTVLANPPLRQPSPARTEISLCDAPGPQTRADGMRGGRALRPGAPPAGRARAGPHRGLPGACRAGVPERRRGPPRASGAAAGPGPRGHDADVVVVGAGIGGLCCGALLAKYGFKVTVRVVGGPSAC